MNSSGLNPGLSSHSGMYPASGAKRSGGSMVDLRVSETVPLLGEGENADAVVRRYADRVSFIVSTCEWKGESKMG